MNEPAAVEVWRGGVNAWECDEMGHMNVRFHLARAMQGLGGLAAELGMPHAFTAYGNSTLIVREHHVRFLREARAGAPLHMTAGVLQMDETEATILQTLVHTRTGQTSATFVTRVAHASAREGRPFPWPSRARDRADVLTVPMPHEALARSLSLDQPAERPSLRRADALELKTIGRSVVQADEGDVFGRMRAELFIGRISDGVATVADPLRSIAQAVVGDGVRVGGAAVEYRLTYFDYPHAGDHVIVRSGLVEAGRTASRLRHWLMDPRTGEAWGAADHVTVSFDLDARKAIALPPAAVAELQKTARP